ncbi:MAG: hypothetical protein ABJG42_23990 [Vibrio splendidus]
MNRVELDHQAIVFVNPKLFQSEAELFSTKWWDYRLLHPVDATQRFTDAFKAAKKRAIQKQIDLYVGKNARIFKQETFLLESKTNVTGLWRARQCADSYGIPYDFWCRNAMEYADICCWPYMPNPSHLYSDSVKEDSETMSAISMVEFIRTRWEEWKSVRIVAGEDEFYLQENFSDDPYQKEHQHFIIQQIQKRERPEYSLATYLFERPMLDFSTVEQVFGTTAIKRAKIFAE